MHVPVNFLNENNAAGVKEFGILCKVVTDVEVQCLPKDLPEYIEVDLENLKIGEATHLSEINMPEGVELLQLALGEDYDAPVASIHAAKGSHSDEEEGGETAAEEGETE